MFVAFTALLSIFHLVYADTSTESTILAANVNDDNILQEILNRLDLLQTADEVLNLKIELQNINMDQQFTKHQNEIKKDMDQQFVRQQNAFKENMDQQFTKHLNESRKNMDQQFVRQQNEFKENMDQQFTKHLNESKKDMDQQKNEFKKDLDQQFTKHLNEIKKDMDKQFVRQQNEFKENMDQQFTKHLNESKKDMDQQFVRQQNEFKENMDQQFTKHPNESKKDMDQQKNEFKKDLDQQFTKHQNESKKDMDQQFVRQQNEFKENTDQQFTKHLNESKKDMDQQFVRQQNEFKKDMDQQFTKHLNESKKDMDQQKNEFKKGLDQQFTKHLNEFTKGLDQQQNEPKKDLDQRFAKQENKLQKEHKNLKLGIIASRVPKNCDEALENSGRNGLYKIKIPNSELKPFDVYCLSHVGSEIDKNTEAVNGSNATWMVIQRRQDGSVDFYRNWAEYQNGFGDLKGEFFIGLEKLHELTQSTLHELWIQMGGFDGSTQWAKYSSFAIGGEKEGYALNDLGAYTGDAGDALSEHAGKKWTTKDVDNRITKRQPNCAITFKGAWWYSDCGFCNLNGEYGQRPTGGRGSGIMWYSWLRSTYPLKYVHMAIRPVQ